MTLLVTGGAGYIGSHTVAALSRAAAQIVVIDRAEPSWQSFIDGALLVKGDLTDGAFVDHVFSRHEVTAVLHLAADKSAPESMKRPGRLLPGRLLPKQRRRDACPSGSNATP